MHMPVDIIVVPDAHFDPHEGGIERAGLLGRFIQDQARRAETEGKSLPIVVCLGDWADMASLSSYDKGTGKFEGRRYLADIEVANEALSLMNAQLEDHYLSGERKVRKVIVLGNHEARIDRAANQQAEFQGLLRTDSLEFEKHGWEVVPFKSRIGIRGILFSHYFASGVMGKAISGVNPAAAMVSKLHASAVAGHNHGLYHYRRATAWGRPIHGLVAGCFFEHSHDFAGPQANDHYWRGLVVLRNASRGDYDLDTWSFPRLRHHLGE